MKSGLCVLFALGTAITARSERLALPYGVTRSGAVLTTAAHPALLDAGSAMTRVLVVAGGETQPAAAAATATLMKNIEDASAAWATQFPGVAVSVMAAPYPDGLDAPAQFPPAGRAYDDRVRPEAIYLWRWLGMLAPDVVVEVRAGDAAVWTKPDATRVDLGFAETLRALPAGEAEKGRLPTALANHAAADVAPIPALGLRATAAADLAPLWQILERRAVRSPAREELLRRRNRTPVEVAQILGQAYGQQLNEVNYIPALSLVGRLRLGELTGDPTHRRDVERIVQPYRAGEKPTLPAAASNGSQQAGHLIFGELAALTNDPRYVELLRQPAELGFDRDGRPLEAMPAHSEMSDAIFLGTPLLAQAARLAGEPKYREMALRHLRFMVKLNQRPDGLHQHSPLDPERTAWGRGNGFVTLGLVTTLSEWPETGGDFAEVLKLYRDHLAAMLPHQDELGMWHQVLDRPESYREYTVTCMTAFAIARGLRRGWLDRATFEPVVRRAWLGIRQRTALDGALVDVCTGTGKMRSLREYLDRPALLGRDDRGGAMAFLVSTELAFAVREGKLALE